MVRLLLTVSFHPQRSSCSSVHHASFNDIAHPLSGLSCCRLGRCLLPLLSSSGEDHEEALRSVISPNNWGAHTLRRPTETAFSAYTGPGGAERFTSASLLVLSNRLFSLLAGVAFTLCLPLPIVEGSRSFDDAGEKSPILSNKPSHRNAAPIADGSGRSRSLMRPTWPVSSRALTSGLRRYC